MNRSILAAITILTAGFATPVNAGCEAVPDMVSDYLKSQPGWSVLADMRDAEDQKDWDRRHPGLCPGFAEGDFYGDGAKAYAVALVQPVGSKVNEKVVVLRSTRGRPAARTIVPAYAMSIPMVVIAMPAGTYRSAWKDRKVVLHHDSILYAQWSARADLYYFLRGKFRLLEYEI